MEIFVAVIAGLIIGSFLNVCVFRLPRDLSVASPARSFCPGCEETIAAVDNIPLLSFILRRGRCRHCDERIPWRYPLVELGTAVCFGLVVWQLGFTIAALKWCVFSAILVDLIATDYEVQILPDEFTLGGTVIGLAFSPFVAMEPFIPTMILGSDVSQRWQWFAESVTAAGAFAFLLWFLGYIYQKIRKREGMGLGDVKMVMMLGAFLGIPLTLVTILLSSLSGAIFGLVHSRFSGQETATYELPFGSFMGLAALVIAFWAQIFN